MNKFLQPENLNLTMEDAVANIPKIKALGKVGVPYQEIGKRFGVSGNSISAILHNRTWRHVA